MSARIISCAVHDFIEIACMYGYRIRLELVSGQGPGEPLEGSALNTETSTDKKEYLLLSTDQGVRKIELNRIKTMRAITPNPYFDLIRF